MATAPGKSFFTRLQGLFFYLLLAVAVGLAGWLTTRYSATWDWSAGARNSLSPATQQLLTRLEAPLTITSFAPQLPELRQQIRAVIERYQRYRPDIRFSFVNPDTQPELVRELGIRVSGELRLSYQGRDENLTVLSEEEISNAIQRLLQRGKRWVTSLEGHGERSLRGQANYDLGQFGDELKRKGYHIEPLELASAVEIPYNTALLVIAGPQVEVRPDEVARIRHYLEQGGNLLWLLDPGSIHGLEPLAKLLGLRILPGTVVDANAAALGLKSPAMALVPRYPDHPVTEGFKLVTLFPHAAALEAGNHNGWQVTPLLQTLSRSWNETGSLQGEIERNESQGEQAGPLTIGLAFTRTQGRKEQRIVVVGDGDFLSNSYLGNGGNLDLGLNLVRWLNGDDQLLHIPARTAPDRNLQLSTASGVVIGVGFLILLPLVFLAAGLLVWRWRRKL
jgi:ABC-type uncharacterized transport system involved in gliding motility auxiliary subunit